MPPGWWENKHSGKAPGPITKAEERPCGRCNLLFPSIARLQAHLEDDHRVPAYDARPEAVSRWIKAGTSRVDAPLEKEPERQNTYGRGKPKPLATPPEPRDQSPALQPEQGESTDDYLRRVAGPLVATEPDDFKEVGIFSEAKGGIRGSKSGPPPGPSLPFETKYDLSFDEETSRPVKPDTAAGPKPAKESPMKHRAQYSCPHCSYKAGSRVTLWRHGKKEHPKPVPASRPGKADEPGRSVKRGRPRKPVQPRKGDLWALLDREIELARDEYTRLNLDAEKAQGQVAALETLRKKLEVAAGK